jgi:hypothetical protein
MADYRAMTRRAAQKYGLDPSVFERQINQESGFNPGARSPAGALGIAQIMPGTARGWGVDPMNPVAALDAAARNMKQYVDRYGGYENALRAYNAGPGNIQRSKSFAETNHYVSTILGGKTPKSSTPGKSGSKGDTADGYDVQTTTTPGVDNRTARAQLIESFLSSKGSDPLDFAMQARGLRDVAPTSSTVRTPLPSSGGGGKTGASSGASGVHGSKVLELIFNDGGSGYGIKNGADVDGRSVFSGVWGGHADHVHVAAGPKTVVELGRIAQDRFGLHVGENPHFGGVNPVHVPGSYHNKGEAIDVSGDPKKMAAYARFVRNYNRSH